MEVFGFGIANNAGKIVFTKDILAFCGWISRSFSIVFRLFLAIVFGCLLFLLEGGGVGFVELGFFLRGFDI